MLLFQDEWREIGKMNEYITQILTSVFIGFISVFKWPFRIFLTFYALIIIGGLFFMPQETGLALHEGLFTWWRWSISIVGVIIGVVIGRKLKEMFKR